VPNSTLGPGGATCPCGKPARRKYCSDECAFRYAGRAWRAKNKAKVRAYMKEYHKQWRERNKDKVRQYARASSAKPGVREARRQAYLQNREAIAARAAERYRADAERIKAKARAYHHANKEKIKEKAAAYRAAHREELAAKQLARYEKQKEYMKVWRKKNAAKLKEQRLASYKKNRDAYLARQRERTRAIDPAKKLERGRRYSRKQKAKKLQLEFSLLTVAVSSPTSPDSGSPPPP
jgi:hypothetical protein